MSPVTLTSLTAASGTRSADATVLPVHWPSFASSCTSHRVRGCPCKGRVIFQVPAVPAVSSAAGAVSGMASNTTANIAQCDRIIRGLFSRQGKRRQRSSYFMDDANGLKRSAEPNRSCQAYPAFLTMTP